MAAIRALLANKIATGAPGLQSASTGFETKHEGIKCQECTNPIVGTRYKCLECTDYNICLSCEGKLNHLEHPMLRLAEQTVRNNNFIDFLNTIF